EHRERQRQVLAQHVPALRPDLLQLEWLCPPRNAFHPIVDQRLMPQRDRHCRPPFRYFQFLGLPSAIQAIAVSRRFFRVASVLASVIHSRYSRWLLGLNPSNVARALALRFSAARRSAGTGI